MLVFRAPGFGFGIAISGGRDNPHFQSGETSIVISDVLKGGPAEGLLQENDRVAMVNGVSMDNVEHAFAVQQLRKSGKNAKITIRRMKKVQIPVTRTDPDPVSENDEDSYEEELHDPRASHGATGRRPEKSWTRDRSASRERSVSPRSDRRSLASSQPAKPTKVTLVKSRKNEEYGLRLASHIFVKEISQDSLAAKDGNIQEGDVVLKTFQKFSRWHLIIPTDPMTGPVAVVHDLLTRGQNILHSSPTMAEPKPVYAQAGQPDVDLPVSPTDGPLPNSTHEDGMLRPSMKLVKFKKGDSVGLRLAGGNDVGIFVAGVLEDSPAAKEGLEEGDQILRVNNVDFTNIIREEAVLFLLDLPKGEEVTILAQKKKDVYRRIVESDVGDSFYIRTHFEYEKESPYGLSFNKGEVFRVVDTLAEQLASVQYTLPKTAGGDRADFWRFRAGFLRPVTIFGPIADVAREKLAREEPDIYQIAKSEPRDAGTDQRSSGIIRLHTIKQIIDRDKHALLDVTPNAVDRLNYAQWYPIVVFLNPDSKQGVKTMRMRLCPESRKSARKLYERAHKLRKNNHHLFTATINLNSMNDGWYGALKEAIQQQQNQLVWVSEGKADGTTSDDLDLHDDRLSYLSAPGSEYSMYSTDSRHTSDYEDTDTEGGAYTDQELDETLNDEKADASAPYLPPSPETGGPASLTPSVNPCVSLPSVRLEDPGAAPYNSYQPPAGPLRMAGPEAAPHLVLRDPELASLPPHIDATKPGQRQEKEPNLTYELQGQYPEKPANRDYEPLAYRYDSSSYVDSFPHGYDPRLPYEERVPPYEDHWMYYEEKQPYQPRPPYESQPPRDFDPRQNAEESTARSSYFAAQPPRFEESPPVAYDSRARYEPGPKAFNLSQLRYEEPPPPSYDAHGRYKSEPQTYSATVPRSPEPKHYFESQPRGYEQAPLPPGFSAKSALYESSLGSGAPHPPLPSQSKPEALPCNSKALPTLPAEEEEDDPAMKPQSVLTRVKMFENKQSSSLEKIKDSNDVSVVKHPPELAPKPSVAPLTGPKAASQNPIERDKSAYRGKSVDLEPLERGLGDKRYEPPPQVTPPVPSVQYTQPQSINNPIVSLQPKSVLAEAAPQNKPAAFRSSSREETVQATYYPQKSFPDKGPINGIEQLPKATPAYNRFTASSKPYTSAARPFERKFESPKFNHNLLPEETLPKPSEMPSAKPQPSPQPLLKAHGSAQPEFEGNPESLSSQADKLNPSALEDDDEEEGHTVIATARGVFNSNGGVLSSIETGVSIIIPQGAIPEGIEQEIYFKVCRDNSETLLSPLVMCGPHGLKFLKPVELRLPHCASMTPDGWSFALKSSDSSSVSASRCKKQKQKTIAPNHDESFKSDTVDNPGCYHSPV
ncbi:hypothetical protein Chor_014666 [Crotalus horridus]